MRRIQLVIALLVAGAVGLAGASPALADPEDPVLKRTEKIVRHVGGDACDEVDEHGDPVSLACDRQEFTAFVAEVFGVANTIYDRERDEACAAVGITDECDRFNAETGKAVRQVDRETWKALRPYVRELHRTWHQLLNAV